MEIEMAFEFIQIALSWLACPYASFKKFNRTPGAASGTIFML
jgi:hypothetical protein